MKYKQSKSTPWKQIPEFVNDKYKGVKPRIKLRLNRDKRYSLLGSFSKSAASVAITIAAATIIKTITSNYIKKK